jgi:hypothetical protein
MQTNKNIYMFLFVFLYIMRISLYAFSMEHKSSNLTPKIQGMIVSFILDLYVDELEKNIDLYKKNIRSNQKNNIKPHSTFSYKEHGKKLDMLVHWIARTRFSSLQQHVDFNGKSKKGNTLLHHTTKATRQEITESYAQADEDDMGIMFHTIHYLFAHNADPNIQNNNGKTALYIYMRGFKLHIAKPYDSDNDSAYMNLLDLFLNANANPNICLRDNNFMCMLASKEYSTRIEQILRHTHIKKFMNTKDKMGDTPALHAIHALNLEFLRLLANADADFTITDAHNLTALDYAKQYKKTVITKDVFGAHFIEHMLYFLEKKNTLKKF